MLLLIGSTSIASVPTSYRFDVIRAFRSDRSLAPTAFRRTIRDATRPPGLAVHAVAIVLSEKVDNTFNIEKRPP